MTRKVSDVRGPPVAFKKASYVIGDSTFGVSPTTCRAIARGKDPTKSWNSPRKEPCYEDHCLRQLEWVLSLIIGLQPHFQSVEYPSFPYRFVHDTSLSCRFVSITPQCHRKPEPSHLGGRALPCLVNFLNLVDGRHAILPRHARLSGTLWTINV